jgi:hypothetical protein
MRGISMGKRQTISLMLAATLVAASAVSTTGPPRLSGDVNGDRRVNVLDIQAVIGGALAVEKPCHCTDVNGDGHTDVLDFQLTQSRAVESSDEPSFPSEGPPLEACYVSGAALSVLWVDRSTVDVVVPAAQPVVRPSAPIDDARARDSKTARYLYQLTPNAPPVHA